MIARGLFGGQIIMMAIPPRQSIGSSNCGLRSVTPESYQQQPGKNGK